mmetsp:Transcript_7135/g.10625  ORF Transcript_7135/g.10625 Transcript_7135/m.10625 type:complete len:307 (-) Transcript_7135:66-986(-)
MQSAVLIISNNSITTNSYLNLITLPHPKYGPIEFLDCDGTLYEIQSTQPRKYGSWFINQRILSDSSHIIATKIDPKYLILPYLESSGQRYSPLSQIVVPVEGCERINLDKCTTWNLEDMCDVNDKLGDDMILYRFNADKALAWLTNRVNKTASVLRKRRIAQLSKSLTVSTFDSSVQSGKSNGISATTRENGESVTEEDIRTALSIVTDYLTDSMAARLLESFNVTEESIAPKPSSMKRKADWETALEVEKETMSYTASVTTTSITTVTQINNGNKAGSAPPKSTGKLSKPPMKGVRSITSFFAKK